MVGQNRGTPIEVGIGLLVCVCSLAVACGPRNDATPTPDIDDAIAATNGFVWQDLLTDNPEASAAFYGDLLGWEFETSSRFGEQYLLARTVLGYIGGIAHVERTEPDIPVAQWLSYLQVKDVNRAVTAATQLGGRVLVEPVDFNGGEVAVMTDRQNALFGLASRELGLPDRDPRVAPRGTFFWRDYVTENVEDAQMFYSMVTGFDSERQRPSDDVPHYVLVAAREIGGIVPIASDQRDAIDANWLPYIRVTDPLRLARRAEALGGQILLRPHPELRSGSLAIIADPQGAAIALQRYPQ